MQFGPDGLLSAISYPATPGINVSFGYDAYDRLTSATDGAGSHSMSYDDLDELLSDTTTYTGVPAKTLSYTHYPDGSRNTMTTPGGTLAYFYYADGLYNAMNSPAGTSSAGYLDNGWENGRGLPNGALTFYGYNECGMLTSLLNQTSGGTTLSNYGSFSYDGVLNMLGMSASVPGQLSQSGATSWGYDTKDRLLSEASGRSSGTKSFVYDASGNPTTMRSVSGLGYDSDNRRTGSGWVFDGNGNPTTYNGTSYQFDAENRLTNLGSAMTASYRFDGLRAKKSTGSGTQYFLYDGDQPVIEMDASATVTRMNIYAPDGLSASGTAGNWTSYAFDPQGSVAQRLNSSQAITSSSYYDAYGQEYTTGAPSDPFGYNAQSGYYVDRQTGKYLLGHRYYDWSAGRFLTRDPIGPAGGVNLYGYCQDGPVGWQDPWGFQSIPTLTAFGFHGNTAGNQLATLYARFDAQGTFMKWGVTQLEDPNLRYSRVELAGGFCDPIERLPRIEALTTERWLVEQEPGPLNFEPWAGKPTPWNFTDDRPLISSAALREMPDAIAPAASCDCDPGAMLKLQSMQEATNEAIQDEEQQMEMDREMEEEGGG